MASTHLRSLEPKDKYLQRSVRISPETANLKIKSYSGIGTQSGGGRFLKSWDEKGCSFHFPVMSWRLDVWRSGRGSI
jgi:hypothetical protein